MTYYLDDRSFYYAFWDKFLEPPQLGAKNPVYSGRYGEGAVILDRQIDNQLIVLAPSSYKQNDKLI